MKHRHIVASNLGIGTEDRRENPTFKERITSEISVDRHRVGIGRRAKYVDRNTRREEGKKHAA